MFAIMLTRLHFVNFDRFYSVLMYTFPNTLFIFFFLCRGSIVKDYGTFWADIIVKIPAAQ